MFNLQLSKKIITIVGLIWLFFPCLTSSNNDAINYGENYKNNSETNINSDTKVKIDWFLKSFYNNLDLKMPETQKKIDYIYYLYKKVNSIKNSLKSNSKMTNNQKEIFYYIENSLEQRISYLQLEIEEEKKALEEKNKHIKTPLKVKSLYYTSYAGGNSKKINSLYNLAKNTEINSVTIDIKDVSGYVSFQLNNKDFDKIKPISNNRIKDIESLIKTLHEKNIYVIGRIVVFKDKLLASNRPDLAIKWTDRKTVWNDYSGNKYMDPYSKEVWDYNANIATAAYKIGFDEINFDYVRFPSDGKISSTYYPFANKILRNNPKWGKIMVIDKFSNYFTKKIRKENPNIVLSADVFGLVTRIDLLQIGQNLESFLMNFDYVGPMVYPSHYGRKFLGYSPADNYPYEIILDAFKNSKIKVQNLNKEIELAKIENRKIKLNYAISSDLDVNSIEKIKLSKIRPWLQGFTCTRCPGATEYNRYKFRRQIQAVNDYNLDSWWVWNSGSRYHYNWFNK
ncbi:hypothetical protein CSB07_01025 [Candidatus Gracilibacteria bacterium]|nr:MAG: hypothetical protein CSB07_01025 [Candidatus Gracilibacteria bacterium]PIE85757.1 MAG: hypothetical protein CSA08_00185 [Candidatus Gracilibacteria bacterium]